MLKDLISTNLAETVGPKNISTNYVHAYREFSNERTRVERRETFRKLRMRENFSKAFEGYFQWIIRAGSSSIQSGSYILDRHTTFVPTNSKTVIKIVK